MKKRKRERVLALILVFVLASVANATISWTVVDQDGNDVEIGDIVLITCSSTAAVNPTDWGIFLQGNPANANLQNAAVIPTTVPIDGAGDLASVTLDPGGDSYVGDDYQASQSGGGPNVRIYSGVDWSTVEFVATAADTYYVDLYDYTAYGGTYDVPPTTLTTATITVVPEPATIALLGLGGLLLMRRRK